MNEIAARPSEADKELAAEKERVAWLGKVGQLTYEVDWLKKNLKKSTNTGVPGDSDIAWNPYFNLVLLQSTE